MERCLKETLRLRPPIMTMMRMARSPQVSRSGRAEQILFRTHVSNRGSLCFQTAAGYTIPVGHQVCVSPTVNHRLRDTWAKRMEFSPERYISDNVASGEKFAYVPFGAGERHDLIFNAEHFSLISELTENALLCLRPSPLHRGELRLRPD